MASYKHRAGRQKKKIPVYGSANLIQTQMKHDLIDEFWLKIYPITLCMGQRLFAEGTIPAAFTVLESQTSPSGVMIASFQRAGEVKLPVLPG